MALSEEERLKGEEEYQRKVDEMQRQWRMEAIGNTILYLILMTFALGIIYALVKFVKWAWNS